ncbi:hypothetical protein SERLA73DRAFT_112358, partial [Serpula lacrymans var. lacrymans S7.3]
MPRLSTASQAPCSISPSPSIALSSSDFPALSAEAISQRPSALTESQSPTEDPTSQARAERKAAKKALAAERAAERQKIAQEKAAARVAEKARLAQEKAVEKEKAAALKAAEDLAQKERQDKERAEKELAEKQRIMREKLETERLAKVEREKAVEKEKDNQAKAAKAAKQSGDPKTPRIQAERGTTTLQKLPPSKQPSTTARTPESIIQAPILSKMPKKNKPVTRPIRIPKEDGAVAEESPAVPSASVLDAPFTHGKIGNTASSSTNNSRARSVDPLTPIEPTSVADLLDEIDVKNPSMDLPNHSFFDLHKVNPAAKMPLEYGPLVHALS